MFHAGSLGCWRVLAQTTTACRVVLAVHARRGTASVAGGGSSAGGADSKPSGTQRFRQPRQDDRSLPSRQRHDSRPLSGSHQTEDDRKTNERASMSRPKAGRPGPGRGSRKDSRKDSKSSTKIYTGSDGLAKAALQTVLADPRGRGRERLQNDFGGVVPVPAPPRPDYFTDMGANVTVPGPRCFRPLPVPKPSRPSMRLTITYNNQHVLHPWSMRYLDATTATAVIMSGQKALGNLHSAQGMSNAAGGPGEAHFLDLPHCLAEQTRRRYAEKNASEPLWWFVLTHMDKDMTIKRAVVRKAMRRRAQRAFQIALQRQGYDAAGRPLTDAKSGPLYGTICITTLVRMLLRTPFGQLVQYLEGVVQAAESKMGPR